VLRRIDVTFPFPLGSCHDGPPQGLKPPIRSTSIRMMTGRRNDTGGIRPPQVAQVASNIY
jgi:hypothetical protein